MTVTSLDGKSIWFQPLVLTSALMSVMALVLCGLSLCFEG